MEETNQKFFNQKMIHLIYIIVYNRYVHVKDWDSAQSVAESHCPESVPDVLVGQVCAIINDVL